MEKAHPLEMGFFSGQNVVAARLAKVSGLSMDRTFKHLKSCNYPRIVVSDEGSGKRHHQHILVACNELEAEDVRKELKKCYPDAVGNKYIYVQVAKDKNQLMKYTLKEGQYLVHGFSEELVYDMLKCSIKKTDMRSQFSTLAETYYLDQITFLEFMTQYIQLKADHDQPLYMSHLEAYFRAMSVRGDPRRAKEMAEKLHDKIFWGLLN